MNHHQIVYQLHPMVQLTIDKKNGNNSAIDSLPQFQTKTYYNPKKY